MTPAAGSRDRPDGCERPGNPVDRAVAAAPARTPPPAGRPPRASHEGTAAAPYSGVVPLQNRVTPLSDVIATRERGLVYGNRGCLHDEHRRIRRQHATRRWI